MNEQGVGSENDLDPDGDNGPALIKLPHCKLQEHHWEHCSGSSYVSGGVLFRRSCLECKIKFQHPGVVHANEQTTYSVSTANYVEYCTKCKVCLCKGCFPKFQEKQGLLNGKLSPRKAKKGNVNYKGY
jgi:hypothetical protein